jgi:N-acetylglucosaminyl-diphospho-decaprenol L-rhamnosyltransferase
MLQPQSQSLSLSIVSHGQASLVGQLLSDLATLQPRHFDVIVTINIEEDEAAFQGHDLPIRILRNAKPKGFGANHNAAFRESTGAFFGVVNPDIRARDLRTPDVLKPFDEARTGACAPLVLSSSGQVEDSARRFPTAAGLVRRRLLGHRGPDYQWRADPILVDWVAGMFVVFRREAFTQVGGFDERRFFMYLEDVDICERLGAQGWSVVFQPSTSVVHDAQRASRRQFQHLRWHVTSALRYFTGL